VIESRDKRKIESGRSLIEHMNRLSRLTLEVRVGRGESETVQKVVIERKRHMVVALAGEEGRGIARGLLLHQSNGKMMEVAVRLGDVVGGLRIPHQLEVHTGVREDGN